MSEDQTTSFLTYYIRSLAERTRVEKTSTKFGFDWIIYNLALADDLIPYRLPFVRSGADEISKTKTEAEFGIDCSFLSPDRSILTIFVLKDEVLCNVTWTANGFDTDLRKAAAADLTPPEFHDVEEVRIVLAYNKDEDHVGLELYNNQTRALGTKIGDTVKLSFERWNLTTLTEMVKKKLLSASLLPQRFFSLFGYICSQFADFDHGSDEWGTQLVPNWRRFLNDLLKENPDERSVRLIPVALIVLREHGKGKTSAETGWIDLLEWGMLAAWRARATSTNEMVQQAVLDMWLEFYLAELDRFYSAHSTELAIQDSLDCQRSGSYLDAINASFICYWHLARIGLLAMGYQEILAEGTPDDIQKKGVVINTVAKWQIDLLNANQSAYRPLVDLNHIELFLSWRTFEQVNRKEDIYRWLDKLQRTLVVRRIGIGMLPFIEGGSSLDLVFEYVATGQRPPEFCDQSSLLLLCLMEFCFSLEDKKRDELVGRFYRHIVLGADTNGNMRGDHPPIDLMGWEPPSNWFEEILSKTLREDGESQILGLLTDSEETEDHIITTRIREFIDQSRAKKFTFPEYLPESVVVLACLKHRSPLPPELWRNPIFGPM